MPEDIKDVVEKLVTNLPADDKLVLYLCIMNGSDVYGEAEVTIRVKKSASSADITDALQRAVCNAYNAVKMEDKRT